MTVIVSVTMTVTVSVIVIVSVTVTVGRSVRRSVGRSVGRAIGRCYNEKATLRPGAFVLNVDPRLMTYSVTYIVIGSSRTRRVLIQISFVFAGM